MSQRSISEAESSVPIPNYISIGQLESEFSRIVRETIKTAPIPGRYCNQIIRRMGIPPNNGILDWPENKQFNGL